MKGQTFQDFISHWLYRQENRQLVAKINFVEEIDALPIYDLCRIKLYFTLLSEWTKAITVSPKFSG
jgi:hypothetical protein